MRSWSQPTESTCRLERSSEVKSLWVWEWPVLRSHAFSCRRIGFDIAFHPMRASFARMGPNAKRKVLVGKGGLADTAHAITIVKTAFPGIRPAWL